MWLQAYLNVIMCERASDIDKFEIFYCFAKISKISAFWLPILDKTKGPGLFFRIYNVFLNVYCLLFHSKKRQWDLPFWFIKKINFLGN